MADSRLHELTARGQSVWFDTLSRDLVRTFLGATFDGGERYVARLEKVAAMERKMHHG